MSERFLNKLKRRHEGTDSDWTPRQLQEQMQGPQNMHQGLAQYSPDEKVKAQKEEGLRRRRHTRKPR